MRQVEHTVEIWIDRLAPPGKVDEDGIFPAVTLISLKAGDPVAYGLGAVGSTAVGDLSIEGRELAVVETDGDLCGHARSLPRDVNRLVCRIGCAWGSPLGDPSIASQDR